MNAAIHGILKVAADKGMVMKQLASLIAFTIAALILISCASTSGRYPYPSSDLGNEDWRYQMQTDSNEWAMNADDWFRAGKPTRASMMNDDETNPEVISKSKIRVGNFNSLKINGDFKVQIVGDAPEDCLMIEGPNDAVRVIKVSVKNNVLFIDEVTDEPVDMRHVIVHISMRQLCNLIYNGNGCVEGIQIYSPELNIQSSGMGSIFLAGPMNIRSVVSRGAGSVNLFTIASCDTVIEALSSGTVNIDAKKGIDVRSIKHFGTGNINIIGATSKHLSINAKGKGVVSVKGHVIVHDIHASDEVCVFVDCNIGGGPCIYVYDYARVGIDGSAYTLYGYTNRSSRLMARYLPVNDAFVEAAGSSHMNVKARSRIFATARDYATIYFYGNPDILNADESNSGTVIVIQDKSYLPARYYKHKYARDKLNPGINMSAM